MAEYVLNRNYVLRTLTGHAIQFVKGEPTFVPRLIEKEAIAIGAERVDGGSTDPLAPEIPSKPEIHPDELKELMIAAFEDILATNNPKDFTAAGTPTVKAVERILGAAVDRADLVEAWTEYRASKAQ